MSNQMLPQNETDKLLKDAADLAVTGGKFFVKLWIIGAILSLIFGGGLIWVAIHFISKWW